MCLPFALQCDEGTIRHQPWHKIFQRHERWHISIPSSQNPFKMCGSASLWCDTRKSITLVFKFLVCNNLGPRVQTFFALLLFAYGFMVGYT